MAPHTRTSQLTNLEVDIASTSQNIQEEPLEQEDHSPTPQNLVTSMNACNDTQYNDLPNPNTQPPTPNLTQAIMLMTNELCWRDAPLKPFNTQVKQPDTFDGSDPKKLNNFILLCNLYFCNNPTYSKDNSKVTFLSLCWCLMEAYRGRMIGWNFSMYSTTSSDLSILQLMLKTTSTTSEWKTTNTFWGTT